MGTPTKAQVGRKTVVAIGAKTGAGGNGETFVTIGEVSESSISGASVDLEDVSNYDSGVDIERIATMRNPGEITLTINRVSSDAGQIALMAAYDSLDAYDFKITLPKRLDQSAGDVFTGSAIITKCDISIGTKNAVKLSVTLTRTGAWTTTPGAAATT